MTAPRLGMGMPADDSYFTRQITDLQRQITESKAAPIFSQTALVTVSRAASLLPIQDGIPGTVVVVETVAVPAGFTAATLMMTVSYDGVRDATTGGGNTITVQAFADSTTQDPKSGTFFTSNAPESVTNSLSTTLAGLSGSFDVGAYGWGSTTGWVPDSGVAHLSALIVFTR